MLVVNQIRKSFRGLAALDGASLEVHEGQSVGLVGPNGSGKSTLLNVITGFERCDSGRVHLLGRDITGREPWDVAAHGLRRTFQQARLPVRMTVIELMLTGGQLPRGESIRHSLLGRRGVRAEERAALSQAWDILARIGLDTLANHPAGTLSGGQQKLLSLGMTLMAQPRILMLDEPTAGVNPSLRVELARHLRALQSRGVTLLTIEHDMRFVAGTCDHVYVLDRGKIIASCPPGELTAHPEVLDAYLGRTGRQAVERIEQDAATHPAVPTRPAEGATA